MPRSATLLRIDPEAVDEVLSVFKSVGQEIKYWDDLAIYVKMFENFDQYSLGLVLIDLEDEIKIKKRVDGEIKIEPQRITKCEEVKFAYFPKISGSAEIPHVTVILGRDRVARLLAAAIEKIVGRTAFLRVRFSFTPSNEAAIRNSF